MALDISLTQIAELGADVLLLVGAVGAALYCLVLARRLKRFNNLENGVGGAVAVLSAQVDDMTKTLDRARKAAAHSSATLTALTERAEDSARKLELMMASLHDLPDVAPDAPTPTPPDEEAKLDQDWHAAEQDGPSEEAAIPETPLFSTKRQTNVRGAA